MIDPYDIEDKYVVNRHGVLFKELIYVRQILILIIIIQVPELVYATLNVKLLKEVVTKVPNPSTDTKKKDYNPFLDKVEVVELDEKIRLKIELSKNSEKIFTLENYSSQVLDMQLDGYPYVSPDTKPKKGEGNLLQVIIVIQNNPPPEPYNLVCKLELSELPDWMNVSLSFINVRILIKVSTLAGRLEYSPQILLGF